MKPNWKQTLIPLLICGLGLVSCDDDQTQVSPTFRAARFTISCEHQVDGTYRAVWLLQLYEVIDGYTVTLSTATQISPSFENYGPAVRSIYDEGGLISRTWDAELYSGETVSGTAVVLLGDEGRFEEYSASAICQ